MCCGLLVTANVYGATFNTTPIAVHLISPNTLYYMGLFFLIVVVRFFKLWPDRDKSLGFDWRRVCYVGLEFVYTASGVIVLLVNDQKEYTAVIIISYLMLVLVSSQIESLQSQFPPKAVFLTHLLVVACVLGVTVYYFQVVEKSNLEEQANFQKFKRLADIAAAQTTKQYRVAVPYTDDNLLERVGSANMRNRLLVYLVTVTANDGEKAKQSALDLFAKNVAPVRPIATTKRHHDIDKSIDQNSLHIDESRITVQPNIS